MVKKLSLRADSGLAAAARWAQLALITVMAAGGLSSSAFAQSAALIGLPMGGKAPKHGVSVMVDGSWVEGLGYRPVKITISPTKATTADRTFTVQFTARHGWVQNDSIVVTQDIDLPAGATPANPAVSVIAVPQHDAWGTFGIQVWEDGRFLRELSEEQVGIGRPTNAFGGLYPSVLMVGKNLPDLSPLKEILLAENRGTPNNWQVGQTVASGTYVRGQMGNVAVPTTVSIAPDELPENWITLTSLDLVCISLEDARTLIEDHPKKWRSVSDWTRAGGNLVLFSLGDAPEQTLEEIDELLWPDSTEDGGRQGPNSWKRARTPQGENLQVGKYSANISERKFKVHSPVFTSTTAGTPQASGTLAEVDPTIYVFLRTKPWQTGLVTAIASLDTFEQWICAFHAIGKDRFDWNRRHGLSLHTDNSSFWQLSVDGVGEAPKNSFRVLITLFVLCIGPLNYLLLRRNHRLQLTVITIPAVAVLVTASLLAFAILADGLHLRTRAISYTELDTHSGDAITWGRAAYYAGLAPADGPIFSKNTAVYPLEPFPKSDMYSEPPRYVEWDSKQRLTQGWLPSRTLVQFVTVRPYRTQQSVDVILGVEGRPTKIQNNLGGRASFLMICDAEGALYAADGVDASATAELSPCSAAVAKDQMWKRYSTLRRAARSANRDMRQQSRYRRTWGWSNEYSNHQVAWEDGRLDGSLRAASAALLMGELPLGTRSFLAVVDRAPGLELGVESDEQQASFHVVVGRW